MGPLADPETWPAPEPCAECGGTGKVRAEVRRTSGEEAHEVEHACPLCAPHPGPTAFIARESRGGVRA